MTWKAAFGVTEVYKIMLKLSTSLHFLRSGNLKSVYREIIAQTNKRVLGFSKIHSFCCLLRIFDGCSSSFEHFARN